MEVVGSCNEAVTPMVLLLNNTGRGGDDTWIYGWLTKERLYEMVPGPYPLCIQRSRYQR